MKISEMTLQRMIDPSFSLTTVECAMSLIENNEGSRFPGRTRERRSAARVEGREFREFYWAWNDSMCSSSVVWIFDLTDKNN